MKLKNLRKITIIALIIFSSSSYLFAGFEVWLGSSFISHTANISPEEKQYFKTLNKNTDEIDNVLFMGPSLDLMLFPNYNIPVGFRITSNILFPIGYNSGNNNYRSFQGDFKNRNLIGLTYEQTYGYSWGIFAEFGYEFNVYRIAKSNIQNNKANPDYEIFNNQGIYGELGILSTIDNGYFKLGINYFHSLLNKASSFDLVISGGYKFK